MDFQEAILSLAKDLPKKMEYIQTEEATKQFLVIPFIQALGYDVFNPNEVVPEFTADVGTKKGEKVDYAILKDGEPIMLWECKCVGDEACTKQISQLYRYFSVTSAKIAVLTNGVNYLFFADLNEPNKMDDVPFLELNLLDIKDSRILNELKRFSKSGFDIEELMPAAVNLKYTKEIKRVFDEQLSSPAPGLVRFFASQVYSGTKTKQVMEMFTGITKNALKQYISEQITDRLRTAIEQETGSQPPQEEVPEERKEPQEPRKDGITPGEREASYMVKGILAELVDPDRIIFRDYATGCRVLLDSNRHPLCHIVANESEKYFSVFHEDKTEEEMPLTQLKDIYSYSGRLKAVVQYYETHAQKGKNLSDDDAPPQPPHQE